MATEFYNWEQDPSFTPPADDRPGTQGNLRFLGVARRSGSAGVADEVARLRAMFDTIPRQVTR